MRVISKRNTAKLGAFTLAAAAMLLAASAQGRGGCPQARAEVKRAQASLARSTRAADRAAASYHSCKQKRRGSCGKQRRRMLSTRKEKMRARDAYDYARARMKQACG